ncbi:zinc permease family [Scenedesmus sp. NREL 46B-D3]|nr:zinc permease family [Scenedesmus sp. NREL 46B-D3]
MAIEGNIGLAFGLVVAAGMCTCFGAMLVFCTSLANHRVLAAALGASAGVMLYVSFVEITNKAVIAFADAGLPEHEAARYATFSFFLGVVATWLLGRLVDLLATAARVIRARKERRAATDSAGRCSLFSLCSCVPGSKAAADVESGSPTGAAGGAHAAPASWQQHQDTDTSTAAADQAARGHLTTTANSKCSAPSANATDPLAAPAVSSMVPPGSSCKCSSAASSVEGSITMCEYCCEGVPPAPPLEIPPQENCQLAAMVASDPHAADLARTGLLTGLAVGLHNLPEGLATFVATLASPSAGIAIAVAIALHNIPEGVVVAMPIYYATKSRWRAFGWSFVSGLAEPIGGLLGYAVLAGNGMSPIAFAVMFGFVAGMMVYISVRELLPTALRYDPQDKAVTGCCILGMAVMASSLLLFKVQG